MTCDRLPLEPKLSSARHPLALISCVLLLTGAARAEAQVAPPERPAAAVLREQAAPHPLRLFSPIPGLADPASDAADGLRAPGVARTSVDHRFGGLVGSAGFLCGLQSGQEDSLAARSGGYDPHGRFLGAKLSLPFR